MWLVVTLAGGRQEGSKNPPRVLKIFRPYVAGPDNLRVPMLGRSGGQNSPSFGNLPRLPVWIRWVDGLPKILAGGVPVVPFNGALRHRARHDGATSKSLAAYARAAALYTMYCAHQRIGLLDVANDEFPHFVDGLLGLPFRDASGQLVRLDGRVRSRRSAGTQLQVTLRICTTFRSIGAVTSESLVPALA